MVAVLNPKNTTAAGLPDEANSTTSVNVDASACRYKPTNVVNQFCDWADREVAAIVIDAKRMDGDGRNLLVRGNSGLFGGISVGVLKMASGALRIAPTLVRHPIDTTENIVKALPDGIKRIGDDIVEGIDLMHQGRVAEGMTTFSKSLMDIGAILTGAEGAVKGATMLLEKGAQLGMSEMAAAADAVNAGGGGTMATASGVYMAADAAEAVCVATAPMSGSGLMSAPLLMSATTLKPSEHARPGSVDVDSSLKATSKADFKQRLKGYDERIEFLQQERATLESQPVSWFDKYFTGKTQLRIETIDKAIPQLKGNREIFIRGNQEFVDAPTWVDVPLEDAIHGEIQRALSDRTPAELSQTSIKVTTQAEFDRVLEAFDHAIRSRTLKGGPGIKPSMIEMANALVTRLNLKRQAFIDAHPEMASTR